MAKRKALIRRGQVMQVLLILLLLALLVGILFTEIARNAAAVLQQSAQMATFARTQTLSGYLFRDEEVLLTTNNGPVEYLAADGTQLVPDSEVARVYIDDHGAGARALAEVLYEQIAFLEASLSTPEQPWESSYLAAYSATMAALGEGNFKAGTLAADGLSLSLRQAEMTQADAAKRAETEALIRALRDEIAKMIRYVADQPQILRNDMGGLFYRETDGYEALFGKQAIDTLTPEELTQRLSSNQPTPGAVGKVVDHTEFYLAVPLRASELTLYTVGQSYPVSFLRGGGTVQMTLARTSLSSDGADALLILRGEQSPAALDLSRRQSVRIEIAEHKGLSLPQSAVYEERGEHFVFVALDGVAQKRRVEIAFVHEGVVLIAPRDEQGYLAAGERVLLASRRINEGQVIRS